MTYTAPSVIGMDIYVVEDKIVCPWRLQCCRMEITIYQKLVKLFPPTWQHHRQMIASITVPIIQCFQCSLTGLDQYLKAHPKLDASLLQ
jgi:hypothetical protein